MNSIDFPKTLFIEIGTECNSRCRYCHMWLTKENESVLTTEEKLRIIREFKKINPNGKVVLTGGETMLKYDQFFSLSKECSRLGLFSAANTNATLINDDNIEKVLEDGPTYLVVSLDSHIAKCYDYSRGIDGSFGHTVDILKKLVTMKKNGNYKTEIITNSVIYDLNIEHLAEYVKFAENLGLDGCIFQMISRTFYKQGDRDYFFENHFFKDKAKAISQIQEIIDILASHKIIRTTRQDFEWMKLYIDNPDFIGKQVCASHEENLMVNCYGDLQLCFNMMKINNGKSLGNIREFNYDIETVWNSERANEARLIMKKCRLNCGMLNCHRK